MRAIPTAAKLAAGLAVAITAVMPAAAEPRHDISGMSCARVQAVLKAEGAAVLRHLAPSGLPIYARYVSGARFCELGQSSLQTSVPAADTKSCHVRRCITVGQSQNR